ncbi:MAG: assimilatory sulfite reductase (NADPH) flavoprotein subunit [Gammaproteobacteria bacterium]|nr:assimilatory sulfite reductase (NADPH) flavoprotein subunit [Gammaproteobacteria bacterium]
MMANPLPTSQAFPLDAERADRLVELVRGLDAPGLLWISGYAAGLAAAGLAAAANHVTWGAAGAATASVPTPDADAPWAATIVYGSQTGNGRRIAEALGARLKAQGHRVRVSRAGEYATKELAREKRLFIIMSTHGDGDPPDDARPLTDFLFGRRAPQLPSLEFAVLALGDSSYPKYCEIGRRVDGRLAELGAKRLFERVDCDVDFDVPAAGWQARVNEWAEKLPPESTAPARVAVLRPVASAPAWSRERPFAAEVLANQRITWGEGVRDVRHVELSLAGSGLRYEPGDSLGVVPENPEATVAAVLAAARLDGNESVQRDGRRRPLAEWLSKGLEITLVTRPLIAKIAERGRQAALAALLRPGHEAALRAFLTQNQLVDLLETYPADWDADSLVAALRPLAPRLYSIASSAREVGDEVHLTAARIDTGGGISKRPGAATHYLATRAEGAAIPVYVESNPRFRLPVDGARDVIMIGAGTGIAPYRAFLQERVAAGSRGRNWLIFGARHLARDFLYQLEWQRALRQGALARIDLAFSRDSGRKTYVQQRIQEAGATLHDWLESGATLYVCGDATRMAPDVHAALAGVIAKHGGLSTEAAQEHLDRLGADGRYLRDVY